MRRVAEAPVWDVLVGLEVRVAEIAAPGRLGEFGDWAGRTGSVVEPCRGGALSSLL